MVKQFPLHSKKFHFDLTISKTSLDGPGGSKITFYTEFNSAQEHNGYDLVGPGIEKLDSNSLSYH